MDESGASGNVEDPDVQASYCMDIVKRGDPDRFITLMTAPAEIRKALMGLFAFNVEVARIPDSVKEPLLGQIRLTWWREAIEECFTGTPRRHAGVLALADLISRYDLPRTGFDEILDGRELDALADAPRDEADFRDYLRKTSGTPNIMGALICGAGDKGTHDAVERIGAIWALIGTVRSLPFRRRLHRSPIPADLLAEHGLTDPEGAGFAPSRELASLSRRLLLDARGDLQEVRRHRSDVSPAALPILLQARLAKSHLHQLLRMDGDPFDRRLAAPPPFRTLSIAFGAMTGRW